MAVSKSVSARLLVGPNTDNNMPITWFRPQQQEQQQQPQEQQQQGPRPGGFFQGGSSNMPIDVGGYGGGGNQPPPYIANQYGVGAQGLSGESLVQWKAGTGQPLTYEEAQVLNQSIERARAKAKPILTMYDPRYGFAASGGTDDEQDAVRRQSREYMQQWGYGELTADYETHGQRGDGLPGYDRMAADNLRRRTGINQSQVGQWAPKSIPATPVSAADLEREEAMRKAVALQAAREAYMRAQGGKL